MSLWSVVVLVMSRPSPTASLCIGLFAHGNTFRAAINRQLRFSACVVFFSQDGSFARSILPISLYNLAKQSVLPLLPFAFVTSRPTELPN